MSATSHAADVRSSGSAPSLWRRLDNPLFFVLVADIAAIAAAVLLLIDRPARQVLRDDRSASPAPAPGSA
ncbi:MAG: hypothetical protein EHM84_04740 [Lysobacterales bacterium]|nr:MAG: hypothetical protein EHM84_04740 [Xanthomonadales bacterium]